MFYMICFLLCFALSSLYFYLDNRDHSVSVGEFVFCFIVSVIPWINLVVILCMVWMLLDKLFSKFWYALTHSDRVDQWIENFIKFMRKDVIKPRG